MISGIRYKLFAAALSIAALVIFAGDASADRDFTKEEAERYLAEAKKSFREGLELDASAPDEAKRSFQEAILYYRELVDNGGVRNGKIYYNIANAYFRMGKLGKAILNYRRAALYDPNDQNLQQNLEYARSRRLNKIEEREKEKIFKTLFFLHYDLPFSVRFHIFSIAFALIWITASAMIIIRKGKLRTVLVLFSSIALLFLLSISVEIVSSSRQKEGVIIEESVIARKGDARSYQPSFTEPLREGTEFKLLEARSGWYHIELVNGEKCWIPSDSAETVLE